MIVSFLNEILKQSFLIIWCECRLIDEKVLKNHGLLHDLLLKEHYLTITQLINCELFFSQITRFAVKNKKFQQLLVSLRPKE
jgi:hypothetical protein